MIFPWAAGESGIASAAATGELSPRALGLMRLRADPQHARIPDRDGPALVEAALEDGATLADAVRVRCGTQPLVVASRCNVPVVDSDAEAGYGSVIVFAEYATRPPCITLYRPAIARLNRALARSGLCAPLEIEDARPALLAHELYHHFDLGGEREPLARRHRVEIFSLGRWRWTSGLTSLAEIAAGAFAQRLLGLRFHPALFELLAGAPPRGRPSLTTCAAPAASTGRARSR
ncbi:MAG TPA: hypothetical protein VFB20_06260 [Burkholderiales bacterium]|nr:hypothetical protein [Burkholderiales bacterium]